MITTLTYYQNEIVLPEISDLTGYLLLAGAGQLLCLVRRDECQIVLEQVSFLHQLLLTHAPDITVHINIFQLWWA